MAEGAVGVEAGDVGGHAEAGGGVPEEEGGAGSRRRGGGEA